MPVQGWYRPVPSFRSDSFLVTIHPVCESESEACIMNKGKSDIGLYHYCTYSRVRFVGIHVYEYLGESDDHQYF